MQPVQHWAPQYDGMEEHGLNNIRPERDHKVVAQLPADNQSERNIDLIEQWLISLLVK